MAILRSLLLVGLTLLAVRASAADSAQAPLAAVTADHVKAAFLYNFAGFVTWPADAGTESRIVIGVMNAQEFESELRRNTAARTVRSRPVTVRHVETIEDTQGLHILYIGIRENARIEAIVAGLQNRPALVVTEAANGLERGSMINFVTTDRVQFEIAVDAAARAGLQHNARLLSVATRVRKAESASRVLARRDDGSVPRMLAQARSPGPQRLLIAPRPTLGLQG